MYLKKHMKKQMILAAVFGVFLFGFGFANFAKAAINPIPGVDIIVRKRSGDGTAMIMVGQATSDTSGRFSVMVKEPGQYTLSSACRQTACQKARPPFTFTSTPPLKPNGNGTYDFTVGADGPFVVSGVISIFDRWGNL